jgi:hypothetical protein
LKEGIPSDPRFPDRRDKYIDDQTKEQGLFVQWLESFKAKFGEIAEAKPTITEVEEALALYNNVICNNIIMYLYINFYLVAGRQKVEILKAIEARGAPLEYDIKWHLDRFGRRVRILLLGEC